MQGFDIIFKEFNRYVNIMSKKVTPIDWATYVKSRNTADRDVTELGVLAGSSLLLDESEDDVEQEQAENKEETVQ